MLSSGFLALASALFFGLALVLTQFGLRHMPARLGAMVSIPLLTAIGWLLAPFMVNFEDGTLRGLVIFLAVGAAYPALVTMLTYESNQIMGPGIAGALGNVAPLFAISVAAVLLADWPSGLQLAGILAIVGGVAMLSLRGAHATGRSWPLWAVVLPLAASVIRGAAQPIIKLGLASWPNALAAALLGFTASTLVVGIISVARERGWPTAFTREGVLWFGLVGLSNGAAVVSLYAALSKGSVSIVAPLAATYPLVTLALGALLLRSEKVTAVIVGGVALTVGGVAMLAGKW